MSAVNTMQLSAYHIRSNQHVRVDALNLILVEVAEIDRFHGGHRLVKPSKHVAIYIKHSIESALSSTLLRMYSVTSLQ